MSMTETRPATGSTSGRVAAEQQAATGTRRRQGLHGWVSTADHKRVGRLYLGTSIAFLVVGSVVGAILGAERIDTGLEILSDDTFGQVYTLHGEVAVLGFLVPFFLGLATYLVPLQVGAPDIAFARAPPSATGSTSSPASSSSLPTPPTAGRSGAATWPSTSTCSR
jgi:cytochrome c oxidase subunit 1